MMDNELSSMGNAELEAYLSRLRDDLEEINEERMFVLGQTGLHVSAKAVAKYESEVAKFETKIAEAEAELSSRS